jgi:DnaA family protein
VIGRQLPLSVQLADAAAFDNFHAGPNAEVIAALRGLADGEASGSILLHGPAGSGRTHLLQAASREAAAHRRRAAYLPLASFADELPAVLRGFETLDLVCLDDVDASLYDRAWAQAVLRLLDAVRSNGGVCLLSATVPVERLAIAPLPDLRTRLSACATFALKPLTDPDRAALLRTRAHHRGLELSDEVIDFLLRRLPRDVPTLMQALDLLDREALQLKRRLTIPFVQQVLRPLLPAPAPPAARTAPG